MKKLFIVISVVALVFALTACSSTHTLKFYDGDELVKTLKCDTYGSVARFELNKIGYEFVGFKRENGETFDFAEKIMSDETLCASYKNLVTNEIVTFAAPFEKLTLDGQTAFQNEYKISCEVTELYKSGKGFYMIARGYAGYYMPSKPYMEVGVAVQNGCIVNAVRLKAYEQTPEYAELVTSDYISSSYANKNATEAISVEPVSGATLSSRAVEAAVFAACEYYKNELSEK